MPASVRMFLVVAGTLAAWLAVDLVLPDRIAAAPAADPAPTDPALTDPAAIDPSGGRAPLPAAGVTVPTGAAAADTARSPVTVFEDEVVITASRYDTDVHLSQTNVTSAEIRLRNSAQDIPMFLETVPGLFSYSDAGNGIGYTYLSIRGFDQRKVGVLVNGIPLNDPEDQKVYWVNLPDMASSLEDIQVQRGITNSIGGATGVGGTVNLVTERMRRGAGGRAVLEAGSYGTNRRMLSYQTGALGSFRTGLRLSQIESDGYRDRSGSELWSASWTGAWQAGKHRLEANFFTGHELTQHAWWAIDEERLVDDRTWNPETYHNAIDNFRQPQYQLHWEVELGERTTLRNSLYVIHGEGYYENFVSPQPWDTNWNQRYSLDYWLGLPDDERPDLVRQLWVRKDQVGWVPMLTLGHAGGRLILGGDLYTFHSNHWGDVMWAEGFTPNDMVGGLKYHDFTGDKVAGSAYANERVEILPNLTLLADLQIQFRRYEFRQNEIGSFRGAFLNRYVDEHEFFNPKGGLFWELPVHPGGTLGVYGHAAVTHQEPSARDMWAAWQGPEDLGVTPLFRESREVLGPDGEVAYVEWSDPLVVEERFVNYEAGLAYRASRFSLTLNRYNTDVENEIVITGVIDEIGYQERVNAPRTSHHGVELGLRAWIGRHTLQAAASRSWDRHEEFVLQREGEDPVDFSGNPIALFPDYLASIHLLSDWGLLLTDLHLRASGRQHLDNTGLDERTIAPWLRFDAALHWELGRTPGLGALDGMIAYLRVFNVLDEKYETWGYYDIFAEVPGNQKLPAAPRNFLAGVRYEF